MTDSSRSMLEPDRGRVEDIDRGLRERLIKSMAYVGEVAGERGDTRLDGLDRLGERLSASPVSPWIFCLFSQLVAELSKSRYEDVQRVFKDMTVAESLPPAPGVVALADGGIPQSWWDQFLVLLDTDPRRSFRPKAPDAADFSRCKDDIDRALALLAASDPEAAEEVASLLRMIVLGSPAGTTADDRFNGASTFFVWGGALFNAAVRRSVVATIDLVVHEASHVLLFGLSAEGALTRNSGDERYASPIREDKRPIDGIFHACFVTTRVHLVMSRLLAGGTLGADDAADADKSRQRNEKAAREALGLLEQHALLTEPGERVVDALRGYWGAADRGRAPGGEGFGNDERSGP